MSTWQGEAPERLGGKRNLLGRAVRPSVDAFSYTSVLCRSCTATMVGWEGPSPSSQGLSWLAPCLKTHARG
jgi:hypothetical protein